MTEQAKFTYSSLGKAFEKQIEDQGRKQTEGWKPERLKTRRKSARPKTNWSNFSKRDKT